MDVRRRLATNLRRLREKAGYTQEVFADVAGIHRTYISDIERGQRNPTIIVVDRIAVALNVAPGDLLDGPSGDE